MTSMTLKQEAIAPFVRLLESKGLLHSEQFVGMGFHDEKLYLLKLHAKPERVVVRGDDFFFLNKKADGPAFSYTNNQTLQEAAEAYRFYGKNDGTSFSDILMVPQSEMERMMLIASLKKGLVSLLAGEHPSEVDVAKAALDEVFQQPDAVTMFQQIDPSINAEQVDEARDLLNEAFQQVTQGAATGTEAPISEQPDLSGQGAAEVAPEVIASALGEVVAEVTDDAEPEHRGGMRAKLYKEMGFKQAYLPR